MAAAAAKGFGKNSNNNENNNHHSQKTTGDKLRASTGIRPSLHPITINAIQDALQARSKKALGKPTGDDGEEELHFQVDPDNNIAPMDIALTAGTFSANALGARQEKDAEEEKLLESEEFAIAGRIMGVIMRLEQLETRLRERVTCVDWIADYGEWSTFGVLEEECNTADDGGGGGVDSNDDTTTPTTTTPPNNLLPHQTIVDDPLFALNRAECLLGIFIKEVEIPSLIKAKETVPDDSKIDFLDADRMEVLRLM